MPNNPFLVIVYRFIGSTSFTMSNWKAKSARLFRSPFVVLFLPDFVFLLAVFLFRVNFTCCPFDFSIYIGNVSLCMWVVVDWDKVGEFTLSIATSYIFIIFCSHELYFHRQSTSNFFNCIVLIWAITIWCLLWIRFRSHWNMSQH